MSNHLKFNKEFFVDFWKLVKPYWTSEEKWSAIGLLSLNVILTATAVRFSVILNGINKTLYDAVQNFDKPTLMTSLFQYLGMMAILLLMYGYAFYFSGLLSIRWRRWLTKNYLHKWLYNHTHYRMQLLNKNVDNPDQRISEDLEQFPGLTVSVLFMIFQSVLTLCSFGFILWRLSGPLTIPLSSFNIIIPGYLFWSALLCGIFGTWITSWIGKKLASLDYQQQFYNADFRYSLVRLRESSEQVALSRGEHTEKEKFDHLFNRIFNNFLTITSLRKRLIFFTSGYNIGSHFIGMLASFPLFFQKKVQFGGMMQIANAFGSVLSAFSMLVNSFGMLAEWRAVIFRLTEFNKSMSLSEQPVQSKISIHEHDHHDIVIDQLQLSLPNNKPLMNQINLRIHSGGTFLFSGQSGLGKSIFLRSLAGLWPYGEGKIQMPKNKKTFFLPQKPYIPLGSLRGALIYPSHGHFDTEIIEQTLELCELTKLRNQLDVEKNWSHELSLGEQQQIAFARIFLSKPDVVFLDESTSAMDEKMEKTIYNNLQKFFPKMTIISVGHRSSLHQFHEKVITLSKEGLVNMHTLNPQIS